MRSPPKASGWLEQGASAVLRANLAPYMLRPLAGFVVLASLVALWFGLAFVLATDRGLDLTDEGLYLLAADPPTRDAANGFPFGWHTGPMFQIVGYDIAGFRTLGALLLVLAGGWVGWGAIYATANGSFKVRGKNTLVYVCGAAVGASGSLLFYASLLSTPGYNWLNLFGISIAAAGFLSLCGIKLQNVKSPPLKFWLFGLAAAFGLFLTIPAKPSSAPLVYLMGLSMLFLANCFGVALRLSIWIFVCLLGTIIVATLTGLWRWPVLEFFAAGFRGPSFMPEQTVFGAVIQMAMLGAVFKDYLFSLNSVTINLLTVSVVASVVGALLQRSRQTSGVILVIAGISIAVFACLHIASATLGFFARSGPEFRLGFDQIVTSCLTFVLVTAFAVAAQLLFSPPICKANTSSTVIVRALAVSVFLVALPFVYGFGSGLTPYRQAAMAAGFFPLAGLVLLVTLSRDPLRIPSAILVLMFAFGLLAATLKDSYALPYRKSPIANQTAPVSVGKQKAILRLDPVVAKQLSHLRWQAEEAGWKVGTPLFGVVWDWASTVPYFLGARVPDCLMLTLFNYPASVQVAQYRISTALGNFPAREAWILTSNPEELEPHQATELQQVLAALKPASGLSFPDDYACVARSGVLELWQPRAANSGDSR
jgi:hypothetical protein